MYLSYVIRVYCDKKTKARIMQFSLISGGKFDEKIGRGPLDWELDRLNCSGVVLDYATQYLGKLLEIYRDNVTNNR